MAFTGTWYENIMWSTDLFCGVTLQNCGAKSFLKLFVIICRKMLFCVKL